MLFQWYLGVCVYLLVGNYYLGVSASIIKDEFQENGHRYARRGGRGAPHRTILVDQSGHGNFTSIQSAIDSVPSNNRHWVCILIKAGIYREKVKIPYDKPYIILKGQGQRETQIVWGDHYTTVQSPTFTSMADNITVRSLSFVNSYNYPKNKNRRLPAVAAMVTGDKSAFYRCRFASLQDTLWDHQGRHYFNRCKIEGAVDFIFGGGQSLYQRCEIEVLGDGFITAQGRTNPNDTTGFVFRSCNVHGSGSTYLGRAWRAYSRVLFFKSKFSDVVNPRGWNAWNFVGNEHQITFAEYGNYGPGADISRRVPWEKKLSITDLRQLTAMSFIDAQSWIP